MSVLIGEKVTRWWRGEKYVFMRIAKGEWECIYQDNAIIPAELIDSLGD